MRAATFKGNIIVTNLPAEFTAEQLADLFDQHGLVLGAKVEHWHERPGAGQGTVDMAPDTYVEKAIEALNGTTVDGCKIAVKRAPKPKPKVKSTVRPTPARSAPARPAPVARTPENPAPTPVAAGEKDREVVRSAIAKRLSADITAPPPRLNPFGAPVASDKPDRPRPAAPEPTSEPPERVDNPFELPRAPRLGLGTRSGAGTGTTRQVLVEYRAPARRIVIPPRPKKTAGDT